ncbi:amidohydrolase family protein [Mesorhizobium sp. YM1C-6-2]|uniref:metal-dependent hydrolase family protein n=1 Tax=Mesorhizobium sp. YM1C-6-2 TaxID=1827501 RepID=UPI000EF209B6|nr:amidohydrolase family protein [Mesorhizobium sp. YM1C-6-2]RLP26634.1 amidohydrolase family protein [Mesorhizobium sp. YM1C-6-2]
MTGRLGALLASALLVLFTASPLQAQSSPSGAVVFDNVRIFDGAALTEPMNVLVEGNKIARISAEPISTDAAATRIAGDGRTLMPGLIDAHWHTFMVRPSMMMASTAPFPFITLLAGAEAESTLMRGFTSVRDLGGPAFGLKMAIDRGVMPGPRIWPSGAMISQTGGHGDFRMLSDLPATPSVLSYPERMGMSAIVDSPDEVRKRTREQLLQGASQIKLTVSGGVSSPYGPIDTFQLSVDEIRAAVEAAANWGTYVTVHAYTPEAIRNAIEAGAKVIDHGQLADEDAVKLMAEKGTWWSLQPFVGDENANQHADPERQASAAEIHAGTDRAYELARKHGVKVAFGTDILFDAARAARQGSQLETMTRWYTPAEVLKMATADNAELLALSDRRNPYPGRLGVVEVGALADLLLVDGDPIAQIGLLADPAKNLLVIMKDGRIVKNTVVKD